jgi:nucleoside-diphosphate-sugar epimerase
MKILIIGSRGFVGRNLFEDLCQEFDVFGTNRSTPSEIQRSLFFDFRNEETWKNVIDLNPDIIINAAGYGVVKWQRDLDSMYDINYLLPASFFAYMKTRLKCHFIQIGSAFEYDLNVGRLTEASPCTPKTHYGISKFMMSQYLINAQFDGFTIIRPFGMFGPYENETKLFPYLITAQRDKKEIDLSNGTQVRDFFYVKDLSSFIGKLIKIVTYAPKIINVGSNQEYTIRELAKKLTRSIPEFDPKYWGWGRINTRENESPIFINASELSKKLGLKLTDYNSSFNCTVKYYFNGGYRE